MRRPPSIPVVDAATWRSARPAARRVRPLGRGLAVLAAVASAVAVVLLRLGPVVMLLGPLLVGWAVWRAGRRVLATRAVRVLRSVGVPLPAVALAELLVRGRSVVRGTCWLAVEDQHDVVLTTTGSAERGGMALGPSTIVQLGGDSGGF